MSLKTYKTTIQFSCYFAGKALRAPLYSSARNGSSPPRRSRVPFFAVFAVMMLFVSFFAVLVVMLFSQTIPLSGRVPSTMLKGRFLSPSPPLMTLKNFNSLNGMRAVHFSASQQNISNGSIEVWTAIHFRPHFVRTFLLRLSTFHANSQAKRSTTSVDGEGQKCGRPGDRCGQIAIVVQISKQNLRNTSI